MAQSLDGMRKLLDIPIVGIWEKKEMKRMKGGNVSLSKSETSNISATKVKPLLTLAKVRGKILSVCILPKYQKGNTTALNHLFTCANLQ